jgi:hypothetical protein
LELATFVGLQIDLGAGHVRRQQIRRELHARQIRRQMFCQGLDRAGFCETRQAFDQQIAIGKQPDQHTLDQAILAEHRFSYSKLEVEHGFARR